MSKFTAIALGGILVVAGAVSMISGWDIVQVERGWTMVISGATALSAGVVTIAIGLLIGAVQGLRADAPARAQPSVAKASSLKAPPAPPAESPKPPAEIEAPPASSADIRSGRQSAAWIDEELARANAEPAFEFEPPPDVAPPADAEASRSRPLANATAEKRPPAPVGRYAFGGASYVLYDDGSIETETADGARRFASLAELRAHIGADKSA